MASTASEIKNCKNKFASTTVKPCFFVADGIWIFPTSCQKYVKTKIYENIGRKGEFSFTKIEPYELIATNHKCAN